VPRAEPRLPAWQRLLSRPRLLHRLATWGLLLAALVCGVGTFVRATPGGVGSEIWLVTLMLTALAWLVVVLAACGEAFVASLSATAQRAGGRPHYQIVFGLGVVISAVLLAAFSSISVVEPVKLGLIGRIVKSAIAGMLPLLVGVTLTAGFTLVWVYQLRPRLEAHLEQQLRDYEERSKPAC
jgi:hypothetical protein